MLYEYTCENVDCKDYMQKQVISKPMENVSDEEKCETCKNVLRRIFGSFGLRTNDGFKS